MNFQDAVLKVERHEGARAENSKYGSLNYLKLSVACRRGKVLEAEVEGSAS